jgi:hypothetical protein
MLPCAAVFAGGVEPQAEPDAAATAAQGNAMWAIYDEKTGQLRAPTTEEIQRFEASRANQPAATARSAGVRSQLDLQPATEADAVRTMRRSSNGTVTMEVPRDLLSNVVGQFDADGNLVISHGDHEGHADHVAPTAAATEE